MSYWISILTFAYLYTGFYISMQDLFAYKDLEAKEEQGECLSKEEIQFLDDMDEIGGLRGLKVKINILIFMVLWLPLILFGCLQDLKKQNYTYFNFKKGKLIVYKSKIKFYLKFSKDRFEMAFFNLGIAYIKEKGEK